MTMGLVFSSSDPSNSELNMFDFTQVIFFGRKNIYVSTKLNMVFEIK